MLEGFTQKCSVSNLPFIINLLGFLIQYVALGICFENIGANQEVDDLNACISHTKIWKVCNVVSPSPFLLNHHRGEDIL
ncbi:hypothetical protein D3C81_2076640 [compost metagenome]